MAMSSKQSTDTNSIQNLQQQQQIQHKQQQRTVSHDNVLLLRIS